MLNKPFMKNIISALAVAAFGFVLLGLTFLFNFLVFRIIDFILPRNLMVEIQWFAFARHALFLVIIGLISWPVFRSRLGVLFKAIYMTVPAAVFLATVGIYLNNWPIAVYLVGALSVIAVLFYFYRTKRPWLYYYCIILVALTLMIFTLTGGEI
jgi:hypothetical protein